MTVQPEEGMPLEEFFVHGVGLAGSSEALMINVPEAGTEESQALVVLLEMPVVAKQVTVAKLVHPLNIPE